MCHHAQQNSLFNKWCWENWPSTCRRLKLDPYLLHYTKVNSNRSRTFMQDLKLKLLEENIKEALQDVGTGDNFLDRTLKAWETKARIDKWDSIK
jgi:hypothetical protein